MLRITVNSIKILYIVVSQFRKRLQSRHMNARIKIKLNCELNCESPDSWMYSKEDFSPICNILLRAYTNCAQINARKKK